MKDKHYTSKLYDSWDKAEEMRQELERYFYGKFIIKGQEGCYTVIPRKQLDSECVVIRLWRKGTK